MSMEKYVTFGWLGREVPSQGETDFLMSPFSNTSSGIRVTDVLNEIMEHPIILGLHVYYDHARINTVFVNDMNEFICLYFIRSKDGCFTLVDNDSLELFAYTEERFEGLGVIASKYELMLEGGAVFCKCNCENAGEQIDKFNGFWREIEIIR